MSMLAKILKSNNKYVYEVECEIVCDLATRTSPVPDIYVYDGNGITWTEPR